MIIKGFVITCPDGADAVQPSHGWDEMIEFYTDHDQALDRCNELECAVAGTKFKPVSASLKI